MARHTFLCPLRWGDVDGYNHVNNVAFIQYLEEARIDMFEALAEHGPWDMLQTGVLVARHEIEYRRPLTHRTAPVPIEVWVTRVRAAAFEVAYEIRDPEVVYATAVSTLVPYDFAGERPRRLTTDEKTRLGKLFE